MVPRSEDELNAIAGRRIRIFWDDGVVIEATAEGEADYLALRVREAYRLEPMPDGPLVACVFSMSELAGVKAVLPVYGCERFESIWHRKLVQRAGKTPFVDELAEIVADLFGESDEVLSAEDLARLIRMEYGRPYTK